VQSDRIAISKEIIQRGYGGEENTLAMVHPSSRIVDDSKKYIKAILKVDSCK